MLIIFMPPPPAMPAPISVEQREKMERQSREFIRHNPFAPFVAGVKE